MIDPKALIAGSTVVYGTEFMENTYLPIVPIPKEKVISITSKDERITLGEGCEIFLRQCPGHAPHHIQPYLYIPAEGAQTTDATFCEGLFTGDSFAAEYPVQRNHTNRATKV